MRFANQWAPPRRLRFFVKARLLQNEFSEFSGAVTGLLAEF
jgi:hypothetical protein